LISSSKGHVYVPIILCSIIGLAVFLERLWVLRRRTIIPTEFIRNIEDLLRKQKIAGSHLPLRAKRLLHCPRFRCRPQEREQGHVAGERVHRRRGGQRGGRSRETPDHPVTIANVSTLLGLLGTISGMIKTFNVLSVVGLGNPGTLAGGIAEALITTFAGLCVAIPAPCVTA